ncbi:MAG TPA: LLM class flavin-dependent oxidoreductase [Mycobacteriales bacterium]|nr:LLM class flavin-dependent oxidoreductase [Mycobacteriales bacterium]
MAPIVPPGKVVFGMQLPIQAQSTYFVEPWEIEAGPAEMLAVAKAADESGFFYIGVCDHVAIPDDLSPKMSAIWYDTIATLGWLAGQTKQTRMLSTVFNLAYRHPLVSAKSFSTLDLLSGGRLIVGLGVGHVEKEFAALGLDVSRRAELTGQAYPVFEQALRDGKVGEMEVEPRAVQQPRPPIWFGGGVAAAVKRAAQADGWIPQGTPQDQLPELIALFRSERGDETGDIGAISEWIYVGEPSWDLGRPAVTGSPERIAEAMRAWTSLGVNHLQVRFPSRSVTELVEQVTAFGTTVGPLL